MIAIIGGFLVVNNVKKLFGGSRCKLGHSNTQTEYSKRELYELTEGELIDYHSMITHGVGNRGARRMIEKVAKERGIKLWELYQELEDILYHY